MSSRNILSSVIMIITFCSLHGNTSTNQEAVSLIYKEMQIDILGGQTIEQLKVDHDEVVDAIYSIAPKVREQYLTHPVMHINRRNVGEARNLLTKKIKRDLQLTAIPQKLNEKLDDLIDWSQIANKYTDQYMQWDLSGKAGGTSTVRIGMMGIQRINDDEVAIAVSLYFEKWIEQDHVYIDTDHPTWKLVPQFAKYELYKLLKQKLLAEKAKSEL